MPMVRRPSKRYAPSERIEKLNKALLLFFEKG
jgi:hypothetical protein